MVFKSESFGLDTPKPKLWDVYELSYDSDDSDDEPEVLHPEDWQDWYSEELLDAWEKIRDYANSEYINLKITYPLFVEFVMYPPYTHSHTSPTRFERDLWIIVSNISIVAERVEEQVFYEWIRKNISVHCNV